MPVLIDGHNLIGRLSTIRLSDADDEAQLVMLLRRYAARKRNSRVVVVFDCGKYGHPEQLTGYGVEAHFARSPQDADTQILKRLRAIKRPAEWTLVSSDRAVTGEARARGIRVVSAEQFARQLEGMLAGTPANDREKRDIRLSPDEVRDWMRLFGADEPEE